MKSLAELSILLVEDEFLIALDAEGMLRELGATQIETVSSFEQAEKRIKETKYDAAVLDVNLNGRTSFPLAEMLRQRGTPFVFGTGYNLALRPLEGFESGVCVTKPYSAERLRAGLQTALETEQKVTETASP